MVNYLVIRRELLVGNTWNNIERQSIYDNLGTWVKQKRIAPSLRRSINIPNYTVFVFSYT